MFCVSFEDANPSVRAIACPERLYMTLFVTLIEAHVGFCTHDGSDRCFSSGVLAPSRLGLTSLQQVNRRSMRLYPRHPPTCM